MKSKDKRYSLQCMNFVTLSLILPGLYRLLSHVAICFPQDVGHVGVPVLRMYASRENGKSRSENNTRTELKLYTTKIRFS